MSHSKNPICYNGDIFTIKHYKEFTAEFPDVNSIMIGRGLLVNPGLTKEIKNILREFHDNVYSEYKRVLFGDVNILYKMKEIWFSMIMMFSENEKYAKKIKKAVRLPDYEDAVSSLFREQNLVDDYGKNLILKFK